MVFDGWMAVWMYEQTDGRIDRWRRQKNLIENMKLWRQKIMKWSEWNETTHDLKRQWQSSNEWPDERTTDRTDYRHLRTRTTRLWCEMIKMGERERERENKRYAMGDRRYTIDDRRKMMCVDDAWMLWRTTKWIEWMDVLRINSLHDTFQLFLRAPPNKTITKKSWQQ